MIWVISLCYLPFLPQSQHLKRHSTKKKVDNATDSRKLFSIFKNLLNLPPPRSVTSLSVDDFKRLLPLMRNGPLLVNRFELVWTSEHCWTLSSLSMRKESLCLGDKPFLWVLLSLICKWSSTVLVLPLPRVTQRFRLEFLHQGSTPSAQSVRNWPPSVPSQSSYPTKYQHPAWFIFIEPN